MVDRVELTTTPVTTSERPAAAPNSQPNTDNETRPSWLPENFKSPEDFAKSHADQRAELTRLQQELAGLKKGEKPNDPPADKKAEDNQTADKKAEEAAKALESKGLDVNAMSERFWQSGEVAEADLEALEKAGIPRATVLEYADMQKARQNTTTEALLAHVGGKDQFEAIKAWAAQGVDPELASAYEAARKSGNVTLMKQALTSLKDAYVKENGQAPSVVVQGGGGEALSGGYRSQAEMVKDMSDPRYKTDEAYRNDVRNKIARSSVI